MTAGGKTPLRAHPFAVLFEMLGKSELRELATDIKANGQRHPIVIYDSKILDGRNRYAACLLAKVKPKFETYTGDDPLGYVISLNVKRRHLDESQRGLAAARLAQMPRGTNRFTKGKDVPDGTSTFTVAEAMKLFNVGRMTVLRARDVLRNGSDDLIEAVGHGEIQVSAGARIAKQDKPKQSKIVRRVKSGEKATEALRVIKSEAIVERQLANPEGKYRIFYADPPWDYGQHQMPDTFGEQRDHYPTMTLDEICELPVEQWAEDDAVLFLWVTAPFAEKAFKVVHAWGFEFKAEFIWDKIDHVMGHYNSVRHEKLYVCTRGACQPDVRKLFDSVVTQKRTEHSAKPDLFYDIIDTLYPIGRRIELFHRGQGRGAAWSVWGNEAMAEAAAE